MVRICLDVLERRRLRNRYAVLDHSYDVKGQGFLGQLARLVNSGAGRDQPGKVGK